MADLQSQSFICLRDISVEVEPSETDFIGFFERVVEDIRREPRAPDIIYITSSSELFFLHDHQVAQALRLLQSSFTQTEFRILSQGCLGVYSTTLDFNQSPHRRARVFFVEFPLNIVQDCLNALGIGTLEGQDGLVLTPGVGSLAMEKKSAAAISSDDLVIHACEIHAKASGLTSSIKLLTSAGQRVFELNQRQPSKVVSFEVTSRWSDILMKAFRRRATTTFADQLWLPSLEKDGKHYMSLKQIMEIQHYRRELESAPLILLGLGAGGRFGLLQVAQGQPQQPHEIKPALGQALCFERYCTESARLLQNTGEDYYRNMGNFAVCVATEHEGLHNHYFYWDITSQTGLLQEPVSC